jgi:hypothetical protein
MTQGLGITGAVFVLVLWLAPVPTEAQQIFACVNTSSGAVKIVAPNTTCANHETLLVWSAGTGGGLLAGGDFQCVAGQTINAGGQLTFQLSTTGVLFGSSISTTGTQFSSFVLQQGIYQIHLSGAQLQGQPGQFSTISALLNGNAITTWFTTPGAVGIDIVGGDRLVSVGPNTTLQFTNNVFSFTSGPCELVITKLR